MAYRLKLAKQSITITGLLFEKEKQVDKINNNPNTLFENLILCGFKHNEKTNIYFHFYDLEKNKHKLYLLKQKLEEDNFETFNHIFNSKNFKRHND